MPNLGAGVDQHVNVAFIPTWCFTPTSGQSNSVRFYNEGNGPVYVGTSGVTPQTGFPIFPGNRPVELQNVTKTLYAVTGWTALGTANTTSAASTAGSSTFVLTTAAFTANTPVGTLLLVGNTVNSTGTEVISVSSVSTASGTITTSAPMLFDHGSGQTVSVISNAYPGQLRVTAGIGFPVSA